MHHFRTSEDDEKSRRQALLSKDRVAQIVTNSPECGFQQKL